ncbi:hypothetical protein DSCO28_38190 [Desulfosarcina ovata subsp. sediminis]|uniref:TraK N-terminal domain-containing protein n=1 Tax=Desulfosarcina ovata subsp. sediminis TaxID=885957 RepID=A0A5K7ZSR8_9BACT|nr:type-F conjugative transfer system secretin TraK [Desulfosarcina ovata]BBO83253.1 hypothetical protein DSCO28_38190 [Desulfosarcina ovata subsp. sediminis]
MEHKKRSKYLVLILAASLFPALPQASGQIIKQTTHYGVSEQLPPVKMTPGTINRIHCSEPIQNINAPQGLLMEVEYQGNDAFVTLGKTAKQGVIYVITKSGDVFTLEIIPQKGLKARVIRLESQSRKARDNQRRFAGLDKETAAVDLIRNAFADTIPENFNVISKDQEINGIDHLQIRLQRIVAIDGVSLRLNEYLVSLAPSADMQEMIVDETSFLVPELTRNPTAICLGQDLAHFTGGKALLRAGKYIRLFIVEHSSD